MLVRRVLLFLPLLFMLTLTGCSIPEILSFNIDGKIQIAKGEKTKLSTEIVYVDATDKENQKNAKKEKITWASSDASIARVNKNGVVKGIAPGKVTITAKIAEERGFMGFGGREEKIAKHTMMINSDDLKDGYVRIHYKSSRTTDYDGWGLYIWGDATGEVLPWNDGPIAFDGTDSYGAYKDIEITNADATTFNIIIRWSDGQSANIEGINTEYKEYWIQDGLDNAYAILPPDTLVISAELLSSNSIRAEIYGDTSVLKDNLVITDQLGNKIEIDDITINGTEVIITSDDISLYNNYIADLYEFKTYVTLSREVLALAELNYDGDDLGAVLDGNDVTFKVWSPSATDMKVHIYNRFDQTEEIGSGFAMERVNGGIWEKSVDADDLDLSSLEGYYYQYEVTAYGETKRALDPYAKSMASFLGDYVAENTDPIGKGAIVDMSSDLAGEVSSFNNSDIMANNVDLVVYEIHIRDFTSGASDVSDDKKAKYLGFIDKIPHLQELGITHVQFLPVQNHYRVNENVSAVDALENGTPNFNWGYDPHSYFSLEGQYSSNPDDPYSRIKEFRELVKALHEAGIGVICDVVYNHTMNMAVLDNVAPGCYHRPRGGSTPVSDPAVESRNPMVRKMIVDSIKNMIDNYGVNGFRFDLMGFMDNITMEAIRNAAGDDIVLQGEAWNFTDLPVEEAPIKGLYETYPHNLNLAVFNDTSRDAYAGRNEGTGFVQGDFTTTAKCKAGIIAGLRNFDNGGIYSVIDDDNYNIFTDTPEETLQYLTVHDGYTLWDKINLSYNGTAEQRANLVKMASAMLFTSQGKVLIHGGVEMGRTKPLGPNDPETSRSHTSDNWNDDGIINLLYNAGATDEDPDYTKTENVSFFHENSYRSSDYTNKLRWERKSDALYGSIFSYYQGLIQMRRSIPAFRYLNGDSIKQGLRFIGDVDPETVKSAGYTSFTDVPGYTIKFINAPSYAYNNTYYFAGEMHPDGNPSSGNTYTVTFNNAGVGYRTFTKAEIDSINYSAWGNENSLDFKLVSTMGQWDALSNGNNRIDPEAILAGNTVTVNLAIDGDAPTAPIGAVDFKLSFENGPAGSTCYIVGEVHADDANPAVNNYSVTFDANGKASYLFSAEDVAKFDIGKWGDENILSVKLVYTPGSWDSPAGAYEYKNNDIEEIYLTQAIGATIDLSVPDFSVVRAGYSSFSDASKLRIKFINADSSVAGTEVYLNGEVQPADKLENPVNNDFKFTFDANGNGYIDITKDQIDAFTLTRWGATDDLNFKIVTAAGDQNWPTIPGAYTVSGNNRVRPADIMQGDIVVIDLSQVDFDTNPVTVSSDVKFIAYTLDNTLESDGSNTAYQELIVIHNADDLPVLIETSKISNPAEWVVILDNDEAGTNPVVSTNVAIDTGMVSVPAKSSTVIAR